MLIKDIIPLFETEKKLLPFFLALQLIEVLLLFGIVDQKIFNKVVKTFFNKQQWDQLGSLLAKSQIQTRFSHQTIDITLRHHMDDVLRFIRRKVLKDTLSSLTHFQFTQRITSILKLKLESNSADTIQITILWLFTPLCSPFHFDPINEERSSANTRVN
jgi:CRISPR/Cas system-associated protein Cas10 (large subunit of type III CRISPR-Cas system)